MKTVLFADDSKMPICSDFYRFGGNVASARNACRKLSTGITRTRPAYLRASFALSPRGTRKTSTFARRAPIAFCLTAPIGTTVPSGSSWPVAATLYPRSTSRPSSSSDVEREGEAGRRAADRAGVDRDRDRKLHLRRRSTRSPPITARFAFCGSAAVPTRAVLSPPAERTPRGTTSPGWWRAHQAAQVGGRLHRLAVDGDDHVGRLDAGLRRRRSAENVLDEGARVADGHVVAEVLESDGGRRRPASGPSRAGPRGRRWRSLTPGGLMSRARARASRRRGSTGTAARTASPCG